MTVVLAEGSLDGRAVCAAFGDGTIAGRLGSLGADVAMWPVDPGATEETDGAAVVAAGDLPRVPDVLVVDVRPLLGGPADAVSALRHAIDSSFVVVRAVAHQRWIEPGHAGGKVVLVGPAPDDGDHAAAVAAALENTARTLSVEWARFGVRVVAVLPRAGGSGDDVAEIVAFLASDAGDYYSGCSIRPGEAPA